MADKLTHTVQNEDGLMNFEPMNSKFHITFDDIGGLLNLKKQANIKIIQPFRNPELFKKFNKSAGGGILLYGAPGCGKSYFARAIAGECGANFYNIGIDEILDMYIGQSEKNIKHLFDTVRLSRPSVLFIDEIDALGRKRELLKNSSISTTINAFLAQMDGVESDNENILIIGATNSPWDVDSAFRRPGRFDRVFFVPPPDLKAREEIFKLYLQKLPIEEIDYSALAEATSYFSGADIKGLADRVSENVIEKILESGSDSKISQDDIFEVLDNHKATTLEWLSVAKNVVEYANDSGTYDELANYIQKEMKQKRKMGFL